MEVGCCKGPLGSAAVLKESQAHTLPFQGPGLVRMLLAVVTTVAASWPHEHLWARALGWVPDDPEPATQDPEHICAATSIVKILPCQLVKSYCPERPQCPVLQRCM